MRDFYILTLTQKSLKLMHKITKIYV